MDFSPNWIRCPVETGAAVVSFNRSFQVNKPIEKAELFATAMGIYVPYINGTRIGSHVFTPGLTCYQHRVQYQCYDITNQLKNNNTLDLQVGRGWAVCWPGENWTGNNDYVADHISLIAWLKIQYADGSAETLVTDETWTVSTTQILSSEIYHGETVDMTADIRVLGNAVIDAVDTTLVPQEGEWICENERIAPVEIIHTPKGETVIDFGQNMTGYVEVKIQGPRGSRIVMHHAEVLDSEGNFYTDNMRLARNENIYVLSGGDDVFKPKYCFQGFRYIRLNEYPFENIDLNAFRGVVVHSQMKRTGSFVCGNEKINQLYHNIVWGQKSNYLDIPTDCPQRNERLGWTGDAQVFCRTGAINFDVSKFFHKWLKDMALTQGNDGSINGVVPPNIKELVSAAWADAACIIPWQMYLAYGDKEELHLHFPMMKKWVDYIYNAGSEEFLWLEGNHFGDWVAMDAGGDTYKGATSEDLIGSAFFAYSTQLVISAGQILGEDVSDYKVLYSNVVRRFREFFMENGMPKEDIYCNGVFRGKGITQTALILILHFDLCLAEERQGIIDKLVELIHNFDDRMTTGFVGTPYILHVLSSNGHADLAYKLLMQEQNPSWLYSVNHGATTMWEHWNSIKEDGSFWDTDMNSFNHYAYGAVFDWIFGVSAGINTVADAPAYKKITLTPHPDKCLGFLDTSIASRNGLIRVHWYYKSDTVYYEFDVPEGVTAHLRLPSGYEETLSGGRYHFAE